MNMNIQVDKKLNSYEAVVNGKYYSTGLNNFQGLLDFIHECQMKEALEVMPEDQYQALLKKDDSENEDYTSEVHRELTNTVEL